MTQQTQPNSAPRPSNFELDSKFGVDDYGNSWTVRDTLPRLDASYDREHTVEGFDDIKVRAGEVLSGSDKVQFKLLRVAVGVSSLFDNAISGIKTISNMPHDAMQGSQGAWHDMWIDYHTKRTGPSAILPGLAKHHEKMLAYHRQAQTAIDMDFGLLTHDRKTGQFDRQQERQLALDNFSQRRLVHEIQRLNRIEASRTKREIEATSATATPEEVNAKVAEHLSDSGVKKRIAETAVKVVRRYLGAM